MKCVLVWEAIQSCQISKGINIVYVKKKIRKFVYLITDIAGMIVAYFMVQFIFLHVINKTVVLTTLELISIIMMYAILVIFMFLVLNIYNAIIEQYGKISLRIFFKILISIGVAIALLGAVLFYLKVPMSRAFLLNYTIAVIVTTFFNKLILKLFSYPSKNSIKKHRNILMIGRSEWGDSYVKEIKRLGYLNCYFVGYISLQDEYPYEDLELLGSLDDLVFIVKKNIIDEITVASPIDYDEHLEHILNQCQSMGITVSILLGKKRLDVKTHAEMIGDVPVIKLHSVSLNEEQLFAKRMLDVIGGSVGMIFFVLIYIVLAPLIKLESPGPVIFKQERVGKNGRVFKMWKFRSMGIHAEEEKAALMNENEMSGCMFKISNDPRVTKIGAFIRKTSLDEFPQFWNVLKGEMSLVGTRPPTIGEVKKYENYHRKRLSINPGITGKWQVSGRSDIYDFEKVVSLDTEYISNWTLWEDIKIIIKTIYVVLTARGSR